MKPIQHSIHFVQYNPKLFKIKRKGCDPFSRENTICRCRLCNDLDVEMIRYSRFTNIHFRNKSEIKPFQIKEN